MQHRLGGMLMALFAVGAFGFATHPATQSPPYVLRWTKPPPDSSGSSRAEGLGEGIGYAFEPDFCSNMLLRFEERYFMNCTDIKSSIRRAFATWAVNNQDIAFVDVTTACTDDEAVQNCHRGRGVNCLARCAEVVIATASLPSSRALQPVAVDHAISRGPHATSGPHLENGGKIATANITLNIDKCFYMDGSYCEGLHKLEAEGTNVFVLFSLVLTPVFLIAAVPLVVLVFLSLAGVHRFREGDDTPHWCEREKTVRNRVAVAMRGVSEPLVPVWLMLVVAITCPYAYFYVAAPCVRCFDYEAVMVHAAGQVLGLSDPTLPGNRNYVQRTPLTTDNCASDALLMPPDPAALMQRAAYTPAAPPASLHGPGSVMVMPNQTWVDRCPSVDDIQGLNLLYPSCNITNPPINITNATRLIEPQCVTEDTGIAARRVISLLVAGFVLSLVTVVVLSGMGRLLHEPSISAFDHPIRLLFGCRRCAKRGAQDAPTKPPAELAQVPSHVALSRRRSSVGEIPLGAPPAMVPSDPQLIDGFDDDTDEARVRRLEWIKYAVHTGDLARAFDLGWDGKAFEGALPKLPDELPDELPDDMPAAPAGLTGASDEIEIEVMKELGGEENGEEEKGQELSKKEVKKAENQARKEARLAALKVIQDAKRAEKESKRAEAEELNGPAAPRMSLKRTASSLLGFKPKPTPDDLEADEGGEAPEGAEAPAAEPANES